LLLIKSRKEFFFNCSIVNIKNILRLNFNLSVEEKKYLNVFFVKIKKKKAKKKIEIFLNIILQNILFLPVFQA